jgi:hypothetical protein
MKLSMSLNRRNIIVILALAFTLIGAQACNASKQCRQDSKKVKKMRKSGQIKM